MSNQKEVSETQGETIEIEMPEIPMNVQVATMALRLIHRSLKLEHFCDSTESGGKHEWEGQREEDVNSRSVCRPLAPAEAELRDACCRAISEFVSGPPAHANCTE